MKTNNLIARIFVVLLMISACSSKDDDPTPEDGDRTVSTVTISDYNVDGVLDTKAILNFEYDDSKRFSKIKTSFENSSDQDSESVLEYNNEDLLTNVRITRGGNNYESTITYENGLIKSVTSPGGNFTFSFNNYNNTYTITNDSSETLIATVDEAGNITRFSTPGNVLVYEYTYDLTKKYALENSHATFSLAYLIATADFRMLYLSRNVILTARISFGAPVIFRIDNSLNGDYLNKTVWHNASSDTKAVEIELTYK